MKLTAALVLVIVLGISFLTLSSCLPWGAPGFGSGPAGTGPGTGGGMMGQGGGMMGGGSGGGMGGMMGGGAPGIPYGPGTAPGGGPYSPTGPALKIDQAIDAAQNYLVSLPSKDIVLAEVEEYDNNFYALFKEKSTGVFAFEMLINKYNGNLQPEPGPNMMWNNKYGMMAQMMGAGVPPSPNMPVTLEQARTQAEASLKNNLPGITVAEAHPFYGYYTIMVKREGKNFGMLSVNGYSGQVWYHTWHGAFVQERELG